MRSVKGWLCLGLFALVFLPLNASAGVPDNSECDKIEDSDRRNICMAKMNDRGEGDPLEKNRYQNKDHSTYYCSLVRNRDLKNLCHAVVEQNKKKCDLIGKKEIEDECLASIK